MNANYILLVDDNPDDVELTLRSLKKNHIANQVEVAHDGAEALDFIFAQGKHAKRNANDLPALVLLDLKLPKIDGLEVLRRLRADPRTKWLPIVILTSSKEDQDVAMSYKSGCNSYVRKPVGFNEFSEATRLLGLYWLILNEPPNQ